MTLFTLIKNWCIGKEEDKVEHIKFLIEKYFPRRIKKEKCYNEEAIEHETHYEPDGILQRKTGKIY